MSAWRRRTAVGDEGTAAVEFGILLSVMLVIAVFLFPFGQLIVEKIRMGRAAGDALRFATSAPNTPAYGSSGRRPSVDDITAEAIRAYQSQGGSGIDASDVDVTPSSLPGGTVTVVIHKSVDLGFAGQVLNAIHVTNSQSITVTVDATGREE